MLHITRWMLIPAVLVGSLYFSGTANAQAAKRSGPARTVEDDAGFFSEKAKQKADEEIAQHLHARLGLAAARDAASRRPCPRNPRCPKGTV